MKTIKASKLQPYQNDVKGFIIKSGYNMSTAYGGGSFNRVNTGTKVLEVENLKWSEGANILFCYAKLKGKQGVSTIRFHKNTFGEFEQNNCSVPSRLY